MNRPGATALFLFDHRQLDSCYGRQVFLAIHDCLRTSTGTCAFNDGDLQSPDVATRLLSAARTAAAERQPVVHLGRATVSVGLYVVAMWSDEQALVSTLHRYLLRHDVPGYQGVVEVEAMAYKEFTGFCRTSLGLPPGMTLRDGRIVKGTAKYGLGENAADVWLLRAAACGDLAEAAQAIRAGADIECVDSHDRISTPLLQAASGGYADVVRLLLRHGANPDATHEGSTALTIAARFGHLEVVRALTEARRRA